MPYTVADVNKHIKGLSAKQKRAWVAVVNGCLAKGGEEGSCIAQGSAAAKRAGKESMDEQGTLEYLLALDIGEGASNAPWSNVDKSKLPKSAFLWIEGDGKTKAQWHLPYKDANGNINMGALRAISAAISGARTGTPMSIPSEIRTKITGLLKRYKIGQYAQKKASLSVIVPDEPITVIV